MSLKNIMYNILIYSIIFAYSFIYGYHNNNKYRIYDDIISYLNCENIIDDDVILLKSYDDTEDIMIVIPEKNTILIERKKFKYPAQTFFDIYNMQLSKGRDEYVDAYIRDFNSSMDDFKESMNKWLPSHTFKETIEIKNNKSYIINRITNYFCIYNLTNISNWTKIHIIKNKNKINVSITSDRSTKIEYIYYDYINNTTPAKESSRSYLYRTINCFSRDTFKSK